MPDAKAQADICEWTRVLGRHTSGRKECLPESSHCLCHWGPEQKQSPDTKVPGDPQCTAAQGGGELVDKTTQPLPEETRRGPSLPSPGKKPMM